MPKIQKTGLYLDPSDTKSMNNKKKACSVIYYFLFHVLSLLTKKFMCEIEPQMFLIDYLIEK